MRTLKSAVLLLLAISGLFFLLSPASVIASEAKQEDLPMLEEGEPPESSQPETEEPLTSGETVPDQNEENSQLSIPVDETEINELPDILFSDPNPLNVPTIPEDVEIDKNPVITLEQAVELAYRNSQSLQAALLTLDQSEAALEEANAARLPTVSTGANITSQESNGSTIPGLGQVGGSTLDTTLSGSVDVAYDVLTGGSRAASIQAAQLQQQVSALAVEAQQEQIRLNTANLYYALQDAGEQIRINQSFLNEAERNLRDSQLRQEVGVGTRFDVLRAEVQFANARQSLIQSQSQQRIARRDIARLLNLPPTASIEATPVTVADTWPLTLEESIVLAFQNRAELEQQLLQADINEQQRQIALAAVRPRVSLFANYSLQGQLNDGNGFEDNYSFGARFNMTLFDGGAARASARQQELASAVSEEQFSETLDQVRFDVEEAYFNLQSNQENIATSQVAVAQAEEALTLANLRLQAGVGTQLEVLTAQSELTQAQVNNVAAILGYNRAIAAIERAISNVSTVL
jgi:outer membrane protein TolC